MRILLTSANFFPEGVHGGAQVSVAQLGRALADMGHDVAVLNVDDHHHIGIHAATGLWEYRLPLRNVYVRGAQPARKRLAWHAIDRFGSGMRKAYDEVLRDFRPHVINSHVMAGIGVQLWRTAQARGIPIVHRVSDYYLMCLNSGHRRHGVNCDNVCLGCRTVALSTTRRQTPAVAHVIYVSEKIRAVYNRAGVFPRSTPTTIIHGAYRPKRAVPPRDDLVAAPRLTLGFFGRISREKGLERLFEVLRMLPPDMWRLRVGGGGASDYVAQIKSAAEGLPIEFVGVQQPDDFYETVDALIVSSLWDEPSGRVAFESGIHGVIPIVTNRGGLPEMVGFGSRGLVYDPEQPDTLIDAITKAMQPDVRQAIRARWSVDQADYDPVHVADRTLAIYKDVISAGQALRDISEHHQLHELAVGELSKT